MSELVSVVIANYNGRDLLGECLESLRQQTYSAYEVIVVDNGSTDGSAQWLGEHFPEVKLVRLPCNRGFAGGSNAGISVARGELIALLNNDTVVAPGWLEEMVRVLADQSEVGMVAAKLLFWNQPNVINSTGIAIDRVGIAWDRRGGQLEQPDESVVEVFGPCGGAALYRRTMLDDVGAFDEDFFCYLEDVDLAWRARLAGWRCLYAPKARVMHHHSATSVENSPFKRYHLGRNKVWMIAKNYPWPEILLYLPAILIYDVATVLLTPLFDRRSVMPQVRMASLTGRLAGLAGLAGALAKRRAIQRRRRVPPWRVLAAMENISPPWSIYQRYAHLVRRNNLDNGGSFK
ncbi:MAG TPA: glycosyltransferase family 2 protein [Chloroflexota bacterium]|nr:glycosyltransferase family 2 protein [Chloroflexota bacterium]